MKNKKKLRKIIISIVILMILLIVAIICIIASKKSKSEAQSKIMGIYDETQNSVPHLKFTNVTNLSLCSSDKTSQVEIAKKFRSIFEEEIPNIYGNINGLNENQIRSYYRSHEETIKSGIYNIEENDFVKLCNKIQSMKSNLNTDFSVCDFSIKDNYVIAECKYQNDETIKFKLTKYQILSFIE